MSDYPTDDELERITKWAFEARDSFVQFMAYVKSAGNYWPNESFGWTEKPETRTYFVSTGGWSGNESIIEAMQNNMTFWMVCWQEHRRGGHYVFTLPDPKTYFTQPPDVHDWIDGMGFHQPVKVCNGCGAVQEG